MDTRDGGVFTRVGPGTIPRSNVRIGTLPNGGSYRVETFSSGPLSFNATTGSVGGQFQRSFTTPTRPAARSGSIIDSVFGLAEDLLSVHQARDDTMRGNMGQNGSSRRRVRVGVESDTDDDELAYDAYHNSQSRPKSIFSRVRDKLLDSKLKPDQQAYSTSSSREREQSPLRRSRSNERRSGSYRTETREPRGAQQPTRGRPPDRYVEVDYDIDDEPVVFNEEPTYRQQRSRRPSDANTELLEALEDAAEFERRSVRSCKKRLEQAARQPAVSAHALQPMLDELKRHEAALLNAEANLEDARALHRSTRPRPASHHPRSAPSGQSRPRQSVPSMEEAFFHPSGGPFAQQHPRAHHPDPLFRAFEEMNAFDPFSHSSPFGAFDRIFEQMHGRPMAYDAQYHFFANAGAQSQNSQRNKRQRYSMPGSAPNFSHPNPRFSAFQPPPPPQPPASLLTSDEAKKIFKTYNDRWNSLTTTDANIPYPSRGLKASALNARDSLWAPLCSASPETWSDETTMKANAQALYLGVVGLKPVYKEVPGTGRIEMSFDKSQADPAQVKVLVDMLKKEKTRWHSDRLGRRNGGAPMAPTNEALQNDERARAVFHAACELMDDAQ